jgi:hypothetical protein
MSTLSPHYKNIFTWLVELFQQYNVLFHLQSIATYSYTTFVTFYPSVMAFGSKPVDQWSRPPQWILTILSSSTLFLFPTEIELHHLSFDSKTVLVGNQQIFGLQWWMIQCTLFHNTNVWSRVCVDSIGYKIPVVKQLMEYLGCCPLDQLSTVLSTVDPVMVYPGGWREQLKSSSSEKYKLDFEHVTLMELMDCVVVNGYKVVPMGSIGIDDMVSIVVDIPTLWDVTLPLIIPTSYQKQYISIGAAVTEWDSQVVYRPLLVGCFRTICECRERRDGDGRRFLLERVWRVSRRVVTGLERWMGGEEMVGQWGWKCKEWGRQAVQSCIDCVVNRIDRRYSSRVTIEEINE